MELSGSYWVWFDAAAGCVGHPSLIEVRVADGMQPKPHPLARLYVPAARWLPDHAEYPMEGD